MRLASHSRVNPADVQQFPWPVKLNRKFPPRLKEDAPRAGDPVVDNFGRPIMVPPKAARSTDPNVPLQDRKKAPLLWPGTEQEVERVEELISRLEAPKGPQADASLIGPSNSSNNASRAKAGLFKKRVREVHKASSVARKTHNEELLPWILEDHETDKEWEGRRKESRRGLNALKEALQAKRDKGEPISVRPSLAAEDAAKEAAAHFEASQRLSGAVQKEDPGVKDEQVKPEAKSNENHAPWIGKLEGEAHESGSTAAGGAMSHALFVFDERGAGGFRVVPVSRMYKFIQKPKHATKISWEEAEKAYEKHQKARMGEGMSKWISRDAEGNYAPVARRVKSDSGNGADEYVPALSLPGAPSRRGGGGGYNVLENMYDRDSSARRSRFMAVRGDTKRDIRVKDEEGTYGELDYEEDFADDEERNEGDDYAMGEEEHKELEQRIKRELARAEERHEQGEDENDDDDLFGERGRPGRGENDVLTGSGKQMKKIMKALARREGNEAYEDDDDDHNPYASEDSEDEEEDSVMANPEEALRRVREEREREQKELAKLQQQANGQPSQLPSKDTSRSGTPAPADRPAVGAAAKTTSNAQQSGATHHRPGSGHANFAQRATSPTRAHSRQGSRSGSPELAGSPGSSTPSTSLKRKSEIGGASQNAGSGGSSGGIHGANAGKRARTGTNQSASSRASSPGSGSPRSASPSRSGGRVSGASAASLTDLEREIIQLVRSGKVTTTKELIGHFAARLSSQGAALKRSLLEGASRVLATRKPEGTLEVKAGLAE